jgi:replicative DNA helicase
MKAARQQSEEYLVNKPFLVRYAMQEMLSDFGLIDQECTSEKGRWISTGFSDLDKIIHGLKPGSLAVVASRPSMGKSSFALNIATHLVMDKEVPVLLFSMESSKPQIAARLVASIGNIELNSFHEAKLDANLGKKITDTVSRVDDLPLLIDDTPCLSANEIRRKTHQVLDQHGTLGLIVIDGLHMMLESDTEDKGAAQEYGMVMSSLRALARETNTPIMLLSPLQQELENREDKRPRLSDLPSSVIAQYADLLIFLYRDECYDLNSPSQGMAEVIVRRNRHGATGMAYLSTRELRFGKLSKYIPDNGQTIG